VKVLGVTVAVSSLVSMAALTVLVAADRELGVPVPYTISLVVAMLNVAAVVGIALPQRVVFVPTLVPKTLRTPRGVPKSARVVQSAAAPIDEAVIWFEPSVSAASEEAA
jgi:hypothetical protein